MLLFAVTALEKLSAVPLKFWINVSIGILIFFAVLIVLRKAAEMNKILLGVIIFVVISSVGFNWIYSRNEPAFLTPIVDEIARFFPSAETKARHEKKLPGN
jgi:hypothetical protein